MSNYDVIIVGAGIVGLTLANRLANLTLKVAILEQQSPQVWHPQNNDLRVSAIAKANQQLFAEIGAWEFMCAKRVAPFRHMHIWEEQSQAEINFDSKEIHIDSLGYIIENQVIQASLIENLHDATNVTFIHPIKIQKFLNTKDQLILHLADGSEMVTQLLVAADGARSKVCEWANFEIEKKPYNQTAIVANVEFSRTHQDTAYQKFLTTGPLAFLPLSKSNQYSIVWSTLPEHAKKLIDLNDEEFIQELSRAAGSDLGIIESISKRMDFPLQMQHAKQYIKPRIAAVGDAIHTIHPLAGQGVNLGIQDAKELAEIILQAQQKGRDIGAHDTLRRYERSRRGPNLAMIKIVDGLKTIFSEQSKPMSQLRRASLTIGERINFLKNCCMRYAVGSL